MLNKLHPRSYIPRKKKIKEKKFKVQIHSLPLAQLT